MSKESTLLKNIRDAEQEPEYKGAVRANNDRVDALNETEKNGCVLFIGEDMQSGIRQMTYWEATEENHRLSKDFITGLDLPNPPRLSQWRIFRLNAKTEAVFKNRPSQKHLLKDIRLLGEMVEQAELEVSK
mgnify:CR=1 FL=1